MGQGRTGCRRTGIHHRFYGIVGAGRTIRQSLVWALDLLDHQFCVCSSMFLDALHTAFRLSAAGSCRSPNRRLVFRPINLWQSPSHHGRCERHATRSRRPTRSLANIWKNDNASALLGRAASGIRLEVLAIYFWATFHKLNTDFFSIEHGCVAFFATDARNQPWPMIFLPVGPGWLEAGIHGTLVVKLLIPVLLLFRSTRGACILLGVFFHSFLSSGPRNGFFAFAVVIFPLLWLFASEGAMTRLWAIFRCIGGSRCDISAATLVRFVALAGIAAASIASSHLQINRNFFCDVFQSAHRGRTIKAPPHSGAFCTLPISK